MKKIIPGETKSKREESSVATVRELEPMRETKMTISVPLVVLGLAIIFAGAFTGYVLAKGKQTGGQITSTKTASGVAKQVGVKDDSTFKDSAEGTLREGGLNNQGTHHLERPGGESQNVYLTSSSVALDDYIGKKVKVWGQTFDPGTSGWFMDVGKLELME